MVAWGSNGHGQTTIPSPNSGFVAVSGGLGHTLALSSDGSIVAWGDNSSGQCDVPLPNTGFVAVAAGHSHSLALRSDGSVVGWGSNAFGQCDAPDTAAFSMIGTGWYHSLGLMGDPVAVESGAFSGLPCPVFRIESVTPNPVNGSAQVSFNAPGLSGAELRVFDLSGRLVQTVYMGAVSPGRGTVLWNGLGSDGNPLSPGVYVVLITGGGLRSEPFSAVLLGGR